MSDGNALRGPLHKHVVRDAGFFPKGGPGNLQGGHGKSALVTNLLFGTVGTDQVAKLSGEQGLRDRVHPASRPSFEDIKQLAEATKPFKVVFVVPVPGLRVGNQ